MDPDPIPEPAFFFTLPDTKGGFEKYVDLDPYSEHGFWASRPLNADPKHCHGNIWSNVQVRELLDDVAAARKSRDSGLAPHTIESLASQVELQV